MAKWALYEGSKRIGSKTYSSKEEAEADAVRVLAESGKKEGTESLDAREILEG